MNRSNEPLPALVVTNIGQYITTVRRPPGGSKKDFFGRRDDAFKAHKLNIVRQLETVQQTLTRTELDYGVASVRLRREALAKSHRPTQALFRSERTPLIGGLGAGEMLFEVSATSIRYVTAQVAAAEDETRFRTSTVNNRELTTFDPSRRRSETGAIESITLASVQGKWTFELDAALSTMQDGRTCRAYVVETFLPLRQYSTEVPTARTRAFERLISDIRQIGFPVQIGLLSRADDAIGIRPTTSDPRIDISALLPRDAVVAESPEVHIALLQLLDASPVVKSVDLPPSFDISTAYDISALGTELSIPNPTRAIESYPIVGIVDSGVSNRLAPWVVWRHDYLDPNRLDTDHGTKVASIALAADILNPHFSTERGPCRIADIPLYLPSADLQRQYFPGGAEQLLDELATATREAKAQFGVRVFNVSMNGTQRASPSRYSDLARRLDDIADTLDVIFVVSAGNLRGAETRPEWPIDNELALSILANSTEDRILVPAEAIRALTVGSINPPGSTNFIFGALANYSRRGPVVQGVSKPDLCHFGGCGSDQHSGLNAIDAQGYVLAVSGTSYAAPLVSRLLAELDWLTQSALTTETLIAIAVHNAEVLAPVAARSFGGVAHHLVGHGLPATANEMLSAADDTLTLIFEGRLRQRESLMFDFDWPRALTSADGSCRGKVTVTLVSRPFLNYKYGAEFSRVDVSVFLQQANSNRPGYTGRIGADFSENGVFAFESELIDESRKWGSIKVLRRTFRAVGASSAWRLRANALLRLDETLPEEGVRFAAILSIGSEGEHIHNEFRANLTATGVQLQPVQELVRVR